MALWRLRLYKCWIYWILLKSFSCRLAYYWQVIDNQTRAPNTSQRHRLYIYIYIYIYIYVYIYICTEMVLWVLPCQNKIVFMRCFPSNAGLLLLAWLINTWRQFPVNIQRNNGSLQICLRLERRKDGTMIKV